MREDPGSRPATAVVCLYLTIGGYNYGMGLGNRPKNDPNVLSYTPTCDLTCNNCYPTTPTCNSCDPTPTCNSCDPTPTCNSCDSTPTCNSCDPTPTCNSCDPTPTCNSCDPTTPTCNSCDPTPTCNSCDPTTPTCNSCDPTPTCNSCDPTPTCNSCDSTPTCNSCNPTPTCNSCDPTPTCNSCDPTPTCNSCDPTPICNFCDLALTCNTCGPTCNTCGPTCNTCGPTCNTCGPTCNTCGSTCNTWKTSVYAAMTSEPMAELDLAYEYSSDDKEWALYHSYLGSEDDWLDPPDELRQQKAPATKREKLKQRSRDFLETFTLHGPARINWAVHLCRMVVWIILFLIAFIVCIVHCVYIVREYANFPKATVVERRYERKVPYPAVTFCNLNPLTQRSKVSSHTTYGAFVQLQQQNQQPICSGLQDSSDDPLAEEACSTYNCTNKYHGDYNWPLLIGTTQSPETTTEGTGVGAGGSGTGGSGTGGSGTGNSVTDNSMDPTVSSTTEDTSGSQDTTISGKSSDSTSSGETSDSTSSGGTSDSTSSGGTSDSTSSGGTSDSTSSGQTSDSTSSGETSDSTSSGQTSDSTSSGQTSDSTSSGQTSDSTSSGQTSDSTSSGETSDSTSSGDTSDSTSSGETSDSTSSGGTSESTSTGDSSSTGSDSSTTSTTASDGTDSSSSDTTSDAASDTTSDGTSTESSVGSKSTTEESTTELASTDSSTTVTDFSTTTEQSASEQTTNTDSTTTDTSTTKNKGNPKSDSTESTESVTESTSAATTTEDSTTTVTESSMTDSTSNTNTETTTLEPLPARNKRDIFHSWLFGSEEVSENTPWETQLTSSSAGEILRREERATAVDTGQLEELVLESRTSDLSDLLGAIVPDEQVLADSARPADQVIKTCSFDKRHCNYKEFHRWVSEEFGMCYTFNSPHLETEDSANYTSADRRQYFVQRTSANTGHKSGLRLTLSVHAADYVSLLSPEVGLRVLVHDPWQAPFPSSEGFNVAPGSTYSVAVKKKEVLHLDWPHDSCRSSSYEAFDYTQNCLMPHVPLQLCLQLCLEQEYRRRCSCSVNHNPAFQLLDDALSNVSSCDPFVYETGACISDTYMDFANNKLDCDCPYNCVETQYTAEVSEALANGEMFTILQNIKKVNTGDDICNPACSCDASTVRLHVYVPDHSYERQVDVPLYSCFSLLANLGGSLALFIGFSVISFFELLEYLLDVLLILVAPSLYDNKKNKVNPQKELKKVYVLAGPPAGLPHAKRKLRPLRSDKRWKERFNKVFMSE
ncbi:Epithelial sodium channel [Trinorchestia longiramus]|nr:Epithelial sodium channel [Trinorchestia longiramus]